jgi:hypothetical protein
MVFVLVELIFIDLRLTLKTGREKYWNAIFINWNYINLNLFLKTPWRAEPGENLKRKEKPNLEKQDVFRMQSIIERRGD